ncbi:MAG: VOC family protein [Candidatus Tectomicrobia bacterium]|uniref:VOC family protein n=1 Tax=Tectimicrobiota bacterium TaxID=2528274 RepID=A0A932MQ51_UNCTE|nr:VOC family protein [Candidatus Tectomicrobia bacterium]
MRIVGGYHHIHLASPDPAGAAAWYVKHLGARITADADLRGARNVRLMVGEALLNIRASRAGERHAPAPANAHYGFNHICLAVDDLDEALRDAEAKGALFAEPLFHLPSGRGFFLEAPDGVLVEIFEPKKG